MATLAPDLLSSAAPPRGAPEGARDLQLDRLATVLRSRPTASLSLDCFDTLLWRAVPKATDVFLLVGNHLEENGLLRPGASPRLFMKLRIAAEQEARAEQYRQTHSQEIDLATIYSWKGWERLTSLTAPELARHELAVEQRVTTADPLLADLVCRLRSEEPGRNCLIVSDTYFGADALRVLLDGAGLGALRDVPIFTSCERGINKADGLLALALREVGIDPADCIHVGDNMTADIQTAGKLGVTAVHLPQWPGPTRRTLLVEGWLREVSEPCELVDPVVGDSGLTAVRGRIVRQRPSSVGADDAVFWNTGATVLGPVLTGFAEWVHDRAGDLGIDTALCLMREGRFLAELIGGVPAPHRRCRPVPFWASREACVRASFFEASRAELRRTLWGAAAPTPEGILATLGLRVEDVPGGADVLESLANSHRAVDAATAFIELLAAHQDVRERIVARSTERRKLYLRYLLDAIGDPERPVGVVDLGYGGTIQALLVRMAAAEGIELDLRGLYLFTSQRAVARQLGGHLIEGFLADAGTPRPDLAVLSRSPEILEAIVTTFEGSLLEVAEGGKLELAGRGPATDQDRQRTVTQDGIRAFQRAWNAFCAGSTLASQKRLADTPDVLHRVLSRFVAKPGSEVAHAFAGWRLDASPGSNQSSPFVPDALASCATYLAPEHLAFAEWSDLLWVGAAAAFAGAEDEVSWLQEGRAGAGTFLHANHHGHLVVEVGPVGTGPGAQTPLLWNRTGAGVLSWNGRAATDRLALSTSGTGAVIRLDRVRIERADGSVETFDWRGTPRAVPAGISMTATQPIADGIAVVSGNSVVELVLERGADAAPITLVEVLYGALRA